MRRPFLDSRLLLEAGSRRFTKAVERLLVCLGFDDVRHIDGAGDGGGDLLAVKSKSLFVFQTKWSTHATIDRSGIDEVERAKAHYAADRAVLVTNAFLSPSALKRQASLSMVGVKIEAWNGTDLSELYGALPERTSGQIELRPYQQVAAAAITNDLRDRKRALLILATGLGKTVVGGQVISDYLTKNPNADVLVVAHLKELVQQLEIALWKQLPKWCTTHILTGDQSPVSLEGITFATIESALTKVEEGYGPSLVMVDETHHVAESGQFQKLLDSLAQAEQFGVTATPWRGDLYDVTQRFGPASFTMGIAEGMTGGFLSQTDYKLYIDNIDWEVVRKASQQGYSIKELNAALFMPQRDEAIIEHLLEVWQRVRDPRAIVFCQTIEHAERVSSMLAKASPNWRRASSLHSRLTKRDREVMMTDFRLGRTPIITARDILNEGVDVPDVNIICFLRVTHSRRIFVQQLGRGLRLRPGKDCVHVLDFVTDIRRVAATLDLKRKLDRLEPETVRLPSSSQVTFSDARAGTLMDAWIRDAASLETSNEEALLHFPDVPASVA